MITGIWHERNGRYYRFRRDRHGAWIVEVNHGAVSDPLPTREKAKEWLNETLPENRLRVSVSTWFTPHSRLRRAMRVAKRRARLRIG